jgi:hypothetical protein
MCVSHAVQEDACMILQSQRDSSLLIHCTRTNSVTWKSLQGYRNLFGGKDRTLAGKWNLHHYSGPAHDAL